MQLWSIEDPSYFCTPCNVAQRFERFLAHWFAMGELWEIVNIHELAMQQSPHKLLARQPPPPQQRQNGRRSDHIFLQLNAMDDYL